MVAENAVMARAVSRNGRIICSPSFHCWQGGFSQSIASDFRPASHGPLGQYRPLQLIAMLAFFMACLLLATSRAIPLVPPRNVMSRQGRTAGLHPAGQGYKAAQVELVELRTRPAVQAGSPQRGASASIEAGVSYQLFQSSGMRWSLSKMRPALRKFHCVERTCLCDKKCNATFRRARFDRAATWLVGMVVGEGAPARRRLVSL
jgi:hypothetical protein